MAEHAVGEPAPQNPYSNCCLESRRAYQFTVTAWPQAALTSSDVARTELSVVIERPLDEVWDLINDMERYSVAWGEHYTVTSPGPLGLGSTLSEDDGETARVTEYEPKRAFTIDLDTRGHWAMRSARLGHILEPIPQGTRFITWLEADFTLIGRLLGPVLVASYRPAARKRVAGVKRYLEEGPPAVDV